MANKTSTSKYNRPSVRSSAPGLLPRYIGGILLIALGTAWCLSMAASGGSYVMTVLNSYLRALGGRLSFVLPFLLVWLGAALTVSCYHRVSFRMPVFALLLYLNVLALITCLTKVRTQGVISLMDYVGMYNAQHFSSGSFAPNTFPAYVQRMFNWGYRMEPLAAGGALSQLFAYPCYRLFGSVGCWLMEIVLTGACLFVFLGIRPARLIRRGSDAMERFRARRADRRADAPRETPQRETPVSTIPETANTYSAANPYSNVHWIYDGPAAEPVEEVPENAFMRPGAAEQTPPPVPRTSGPFTAVQTQNDLYHEPFVLHPDGAYDVSDAALDVTPAAETPPARETPKPEPARQDFANTVPETAKQEPVRQDSAYTARDPVPVREREVMEPVRAKPQPETLPPEDDDTPPWDTAPAEPVQPARPARQAEAAQTDPSEPAEDSGELSPWQARLREIQSSLNTTRTQLQQTKKKNPEPVHTDPVDLPPIRHEPIQPSRTPVKTEEKRIDDTPVMKPKPVSRNNNGPYTPPPMSFLAMPRVINPGESVQEDERKANQIERTLKTFNVEAEVREITHGPAITRFALKLAEGVKVKQVVGVLDNIMLEMGSDRIRIETPIPGTSYIGIEVPNSRVSAVTLREVLDSPEMHAASAPLSVALGKDIAGKPIIGDLSKMPHLLIAGATGSGKSVCINSIVCSLLYRTSPKDVRLIMVDPKQVELQVYNGIPHLLLPVISDPKKAAVALNWVVNEMLERYSKFSKQNVRNLEGYNKKLGGEERLPHIVVIIDEMADLMEVCRKDVEESIRRLAALARAAGIYLVLATQRPSVDVITGVIKNNIPSRIAFTVSSGVDSRTIIDINGAEKLMGKGDMLYLPVGASKPLRVQGCFVSDDEVAHISENIQARYQPDYNPAIQEIIERPTETVDADDVPETPSEVRESEFTDLMSEAIRMAVQDGQTSISMLQRTLRIGYARAGRIIDEMTKRGIISEAEGSKPRKTIITRDEYIQMMSEGLLNGENNDG